LATTWATITQKFTLSWDCSPFSINGIFT
jgi:hypothetical protein